jgi:hypothetical protein
MFILRSLLPSQYSGESISVHQHNECYAVGLFFNSLCDDYVTLIFKDEISHETIRFGHILSYGTCNPYSLRLLLQSKRNRYLHSILTLSHVEGSDPVTGDILCLAGAFLYAISNVSEEAIVKKHGRTEWLSFIGIGGTILSGAQLY